MLVVKRVQVHVFASRWDTYYFSIERSKEKHLSEHRFDWYRETSCPHKDRNIYACVFCAFVSLFHLSLRQRHESKNAMCTLCASCCAILLYTVQNACYTFCAWLIVFDCVNCSLSPACSLSLSLSVGCFFPSLVFWQEAPPIASCPLLLSVPQGDKLFINHFLFLYRYAFKKLFLIRLLSCISCICDLAAAEAPSCPPGYILR